MEVMITVAIVAILSAIAIPSYRDYVTRGKLVDATNQLSALSANMERYFQDNRSYAPATDATNPCNAGRLPATQDFTFTCNNITATSYTAVATGLGFVLNIDQTGRQGTITAPSGWPTCANKWLISKSAIC
jgi:type IV pilus assembly protein PilE